MGMTRADLEKRVAIKINQWSGAAFIDGLVTAAMVDVWLQDRYDELYLHLARKYHQDFERTTLIDIGTTYEATTEGIYDLEAEMSNSLELLWVGIKYASTNANYQRMTPLHFNDAYQTGAETFAASDPYYHLTNVTVTAVKKKAIQLLPRPTVDTLDGLKIMDIERPAALDGSTGVTNLIPEPAHSFIAEGALIDAYDTLGGDYLKKSVKQENRWNQLKEMMCAYYLPQVTDQPRRLKQSRRLYSMGRRDV